MNIKNIVNAVNAFIKTLAALSTSILLCPKKIGGLCEPLLDHYLHNKLQDIIHEDIEEFLLREYGENEELFLNLSLPIIVGMRGITLSEAFVLAALIKVSKARQCYEIGTYKGWTSHFLASSLGKDGKVYTLDLNSGQNAIFGVKPRDEYGLSEDEIGYVSKQCQIHNNQVEQLFGDSAQFDFSSYKEQIDVVFIDGAHSAAYIKSDTKNALTMVHENSLIIWHDYKYACPEVVKYLNRMAKKCKLYHIKNTSLVIYRVKR
jgi:predicted O-methyltransferase YrrM